MGTTITITHATAIRMSTERCLFRGFNFHGLAINCEIHKNWTPQKFPTIYAVHLFNELLPKSQIVFQSLIHDIVHVSMLGNKTKLIHVTSTSSASVAQRLEHWSRKPGVESSNLSRGWFFFSFLYMILLFFFSPRDLSDDELLANLKMSDNDWYSISYVQVNPPAWLIRVHACLHNVTYGKMKSYLSIDLGLLFPLIYTTAHTMYTCTVIP